MIVRVEMAGKTRELECDGYACVRGLLWFYRDANTEDPFLIVKTWDAVEVLPERPVS